MYNGQYVLQECLNINVISVLSSIGGGTDRSLKSRFLFVRDERENSFPTKERIKNYIVCVMKEIASF